MPKIKLTKSVVDARADREARRLMQAPCVDPIIASAVLAKVPDAKVFRTAHDFAAWIGPTGRDCGTGGKHQVGSISKQGDRMLRTLLINGTSAHLRQHNYPSRNPSAHSVTHRHFWSMIERDGDLSIEVLTPQVGIPRQSRRAVAYGVFSTETSKIGIEGDSVTQFSNPDTLWGARFESKISIYDPPGKAGDFRNWAAQSGHWGR